MVALLTGVTMGLVFAVLGAGGGIIAVPVLLVLFKLPLSAATGAGLAVVFAAALTAALGHARRVAWREVVLIGPPSMLGAVLGSKLNTLVPERVTYALFALVLVLATASLFLPKKDAPAARPKWVLLTAGLGLGVLTGFLGVGGGFLMVPALVGLAQLPLHRAVATSSALIAASSFAGATATMVNNPELANLILPIAAGAAVGALLGVPLAGRLPAKPLRAAFSVLALTVAGGMAWRAF